MQRYFVEKLNYQIVGSDVHHITRVMRMQVKDQCIVCCEGQCFLTQLTKIENVVEYKIIQELEKPKTIQSTLIQGLPKHPKTEFVTKYATVFGVSKIIFVPMKRSIAKLENNEKKQARLQSIAKEAAELAHRFEVPTIEFVSALKQIDFDVFDIVLLADETHHQQHIQDFINAQEINKKLAILIGPEGGISPEERHFLQQKEAKTIALGSEILPTEAASLYLLSVLSNLGNTLIK